MYISTVEMYYSYIVSGGHHLQNEMYISTGQMYISIWRPPDKNNTSHLLKYTSFHLKYTSHSLSGGRHLKSEMYISSGKMYILTGQMYISSTSHQLKYISLYLKYTSLLTRNTFHPL